MKEAEGRREVRGPTGRGRRRTAWARGLVWLTSTCALAAAAAASQDPAGAGDVPATAPAIAPQSQAPSKDADSPRPQNAEPQPGAPTAAPAAPALPVYQPRYRGASEAALWCDTLELAAPDRVRRFELATTRDGRVTPALEIAAPGPLPPAQRPTVLLIGALDGRSLAGAEAALYTARELAQDALSLGPHLTVIVVPFANVEALDECSRSGRSTGRTSRPVDDDHDGLVDEDGPDDVDDDGLILEMLVEAPDGAWRLTEDLRWAVPAELGAGRRFHRVPEGRDDDGDGRYNEDGPGGVDLDRNFPVGREGPWSDPSVGALPLCEPVSRALAELARSRRCFGVLLLQGRHGGVAFPGGVEALEQWSAADARLYDLIGARFRRSTGRANAGLRSLRAARGQNTPGAALDWFAASCGALALEVAPWGPQVDTQKRSPARPAGFDARSASDRALDGLLGDLDQSWSRWLDDLRGGLGYVSWRPVDLRNGRAAYVGGFEPWTIENPPRECLDGALHGLPQFVREVCDAAPRLELENVSVTRSAGVLRVRASVRNSGVLPTGLSAPSATSSVEPLRIRLELGADAKLLAGAAVVRLEPLAGGALSREVEWLVLANAPAVLALRAQGGWCSPVSCEVRE